MDEHNQAKKPNPDLRQIRTREIVVVDIPGHGCLHLPREHAAHIHAVITHDLITAGILPVPGPFGQGGLHASLARLLNELSEENQSNTPDFILARFAVGALDSLNKAIRDRDSWYGISPSPGQAAQEKPNESSPSNQSYQNIGTSEAPPEAGSGDDLGEFIRERCIFDKGSHVRLDELYGHYFAWNQPSAAEPLTMDEVAAALPNRWDVKVISPRRLYTHGSNPLVMGLRIAPRDMDRPKIDKVATP